MKTANQLNNPLFSSILVLALVVGAGLATSSPLLSQENLSDFDSTGIPIEPPTDNGGGTVEGGNCTFYLSRAGFDADFPGLPVEDFEGGNVGPGGVIGCDAPIDSTTTNACFNAGDILPGIQFSDNPGPDANGMVVIGAGFNGNPSVQLLANTFVDSFLIDFSPGVAAAGMDLASHFDADTLDITVVGASGVLDNTSAAGTNGGAFWGVACNEPVTQIELDSPTDEAEGVDNLAFGAGAPTTGTLPMMLLVVLLAVGSIAILMRRRQA